MLSDSQYKVDISKYFAGPEVPSEELGQYCLNKVMHYDNYISNSGYLSLLRRSYRAYYGYATNDWWHQSSNVVFDGEQGELALMKMNDYRSILTNFLSLITNQKLNFDPRAINNDTESLAQTLVAHSVIEDVLKNKGLGRKAVEAVEMSLWGAEGFILTYWDKYKGQLMGTDPNTGEVFYEGDGCSEVFLGLDVIREPQTKSFDDCEYFIVRKWVNKYNWAALFPEKRDEILNAGDEAQLNRMGRFLTPMQWSQNQNQDYVPIYILLHKKTPACPDGRYAIMLGSGGVTLVDEPLQFDSVMLERISMADIKDTPLGYTLGFDLLGPQMALDSLCSTAITNANAFGVQNILVPKGADLNYTKLGGGLNVITHNQGLEPKPMGLIQTPPEVYKLIEMMVQSMGRLSNISATNRGQPEANLKSGSALALVASQALQFVNILQQSYVQAMESTMTSWIELYQKYVSEPRMLELAGKDKAQYIPSFSGKDLDKVKRIYVDLGNPLSRTAAGRQQLADSLLEKGLVKTPQEYITVINTGTLEPAVNNPIAVEMLIKEENDRLVKGEEVVAIGTDLHFEHVLGHASILQNYKNRLDPNMAQRVTAHIQEHLDLLRVTDPALLAMLGQQSTAPQAPAGEATAPGEGPNAPVDQQTEQVNMPSMPTNPLTGEKFQPAIG